MRFREAFHANFALAVAAIFGGFLGAGLLANHHPMAGTILTLGGALWFAGWIVTLPRTPSLVRFWLLIFLCGGTLGFLLQEWDQEQNYQLSQPARVPVPGNRPLIPGLGGPAQVDRGRQSHDSFGHIGGQVAERLRGDVVR